MTFRHQFFHNDRSQQPLLAVDGLEFGAAARFGRFALRLLWNFQQNALLLTLHALLSPETFTGLNGFYGFRDFFTASYASGSVSGLVVGQKM
jgi:hypothetical protein